MGPPRVIGPRGSLDHPAFTNNRIMCVQRPLWNSRFEMPETESFNTETLYSFLYATHKADTHTKNKDIQYIFIGQ